MCNKPPTASSEVTRQVMQSNRSTGTNPEIELLRLVREKDLRGYRKNYKKIPGKPDIYVPKAKLAVYMHGCFWHRCPHCNPTTPKTNTEFWVSKFQTNMKRDKRVKRRLSRMGVSFLTIWECQLVKKGEACVGRITKAVQDRK